MDNGAQVSLEYLLILAAILALVAIATGMAASMFDVGRQMQSSMGNFTDGAGNMLG